MFITLLHWTANYIMQTKFNFQYLTFPACSNASFPSFVYPPNIFICSTPAARIKGTNARIPKVNSHEKINPIMTPVPILAKVLTPVPSRAPVA